ncbi:E3 ubiquitin-protein ligase RNF126-like [Hibiscus syriacus]|uniref:E3 ubiquitin-protein ligase RNF126-like n=1 Tax=Hibiscus syriacus TaxID=106335 RepID=UPI001920A223|nr:E3 ubiquitin-protein ligase RNF126-like [Hibiscus syriacus]
MEYKVVTHQSHPLQFTPHHRQLPPSSIYIVLTVSVSYISAASADPFFSQRTLCFRLNLLQSPRRLNQVLAPELAELRVDTSSAEYDGVLQDIIQCGLLTVRGMLDQGYYCQALQLHSDMLVAMEPMTDQETLMTRALAESRMEFENSNYGMVGASESSVKKMVKKVKVEDGEGGDCMVCLEELRFGFEASRMPCSHLFHGGCIERWLKQSHYCPICRFEMPTN